MMDRVLMFVSVVAVLFVTEACWVYGELRRKDKRRKGEERQRIRITYRYETPRIEGVPPHIAGEDVAGRETFAACGRS